MSTVSLGRPGRVKLRTQAGNRYRKRPEETLFARICRLFKLVTVSTAVLVFLAVMSVGLLFGYRWLTSSSFFGLEQISVQGHERLTRGEVLGSADVGPGLNCLGLNVSEVRGRLAANPWISWASVRRELPASLYIKIREREPQFWVRKDGTLHYADAEGHIIAPVTPERFASLPVLTVEEGAQSYFTMLPELLDMMEDGHLPFSLAQVAWIRLTGTRELELRLDQPRVTLTFELDGWRTKLERVNLVWRDLHRRGEFSTAEVISARGGRVWVDRSIES